MAASTMYFLYQEAYLEAQPFITKPILSRNPAYLKALRLILALKLCELNGKTDMLEYSFLKKKKTTRRWRVRQDPY
ncbi:hypothetical protein CUMW_089580 [Citrus unshiu]|nr:hypothetical protein CUMW_089580 [Citrus unshiu]